MCNIPGTLQSKSRTSSESTDTEAFNLHCEALDNMALIYSDLKEEDLWSGLWQKRAIFTETAVAVGLEQQGLFNQATEAYERAFARHSQEYANGPTPYHLNSECNLWWDHYIRLLSLVLL